MTIVCYKDGILACDSALFLEDVIVSTTFNKIRQTKDGCLVGGAGTLAVLEEFHTWANGTRKRAFETSLTDEEDVADFVGILIDPNGRLREYHCDHSTQTDAEFVAIGAPWQLAMGAMAAGASAEEAVRICIERHVFAAGSPQVLQLSPS